MQLLQGLRHARDQVRPELELHLLVEPHQLRALDVGQGAAEPLEYDVQPLVHAPGDVELLPRLVERGVRGVVDGVDELPVNVLVAGAVPVHELAALIFLRRPAGRLALRLVRVVADDRVPQVEGDGFYFRHRDFSYFFALMYLTPSMSVKSASWVSRTADVQAGCGQNQTVGHGQPLVRAKPCALKSDALVHRDHTSLAHGCNRMQSGVLVLFPEKLFKHLEDVYSRYDKTVSILDRGREKVCVFPVSEVFQPAG